MFNSDDLLKDYDKLRQNRKASLQVGEDTFYLLRPEYWSSKKKRSRPIQAAKDFVSWLFCKPDFMITTEDPGTVQLLKRFGLTEGKTPASRVTSFVGYYLRGVVQRSAVSSFSDMTHEKIKIAKDLQKAMAYFEEKELSIGPDDFIGQEKLRNQILKAIDKALIDNGELAYGIFHSAGELEGCLLKAKHFIESYQFPSESFTRSDQMRPICGPNQAFHYRASDHGFTPDRARKFLVSLYAHRRQKKLSRTKYVATRRLKQVGQVASIKSYDFVLDEDMANLDKKMKTFSSSALTKITRGIAKLTSTIIRLPFDVLLGTARHIRTEYKDWRAHHINSPPTEEEKEKMFKAFKEALEKEIAAEEKGEPSPGLLVPKDPSTKPSLVALKAIREQTLFEHTNFFARILRPTGQLATTSQNDIIDNPVLYAAMFSLGFAPAVGIFVPYQLANLIGSYGSNSALHKVLTKIMLLQNTPFEKALTVIRSSSLSFYIADIARANSMKSFFDDIDIRMEDPFELINIAVTASYLGSSVNLKLNSDDVTKFSPKLDDTSQGVTFTQNTHSLIPDPSKVLLSFLKMGLEFIVTPVRLLGAIGVAIATRRLEPLRREAKRFTKKLLRMVHGSLDFFVALTRHLWDATTAIPKIFFALFTSLSSKVLGTVGDICENIGDLLLYPFRHASHPVLKALGLIPAVPGAIMWGIGKGLEITSRALSWFKQTGASLVERFINRPVQSFFRKGHNYLGRSFNPNHPWNKICSQINRITEMKNFLEGHLEGAPREVVRSMGVEFGMLSQLQKILLEYQKKIRSSNSFDDPRITQQMHEDVKKATAAYAKALCELPATPHEDPTIEAFIKECKDSILLQHRSNETLRARKEYARSIEDEHTTEDVLNQVQKRKGKIPRFRPQGF